MPKKKYQVIKATTREIPGVYVGGKKRVFDRNGTFTVSDSGEANEINKVLGAKGTGEVVVTPYKDHTTNEPGHRYTFGAMTSQQARENYDRIFRKPKKERKARRVKRREVRNGV